MECTGFSVFAVWDATRWRHDLLFAPCFAPTSSFMLRSLMRLLPFPDAMLLVPSFRPADQPDQANTLALMSEPSRRPRNFRI